MGMPSRAALHVLGGYDGHSALDCADRLDISGNGASDSGGGSSNSSWMPLPALSAGPRRGLAAAAFNGALWAIGGSSGRCALPVVERLDPGADRWCAGPPLYGRRYMLATVPLGGSLYVLGGAGDGGLVLATVERLGPGKDADWSAARPLPSIRSHLAAAAPGDGALYAIGGTDGCNALAVVERFEPAAGELGVWTAAPALSIARYHLAAAALDGALYAFGGWQLPGVPSAVAERLDPRTAAWSALPPMPTPRAGLAAAATTGGGSALFVAGGHDCHAPLASVDCFDVRANAWRPLTALSHGRSSLAAVAL
eukprot:NODE_7223_length_1598_cov_6.222978.p1 GENE.NODE_7223_length_1598_cov_6.222978~~NODE_7223_length_1598_cov_6.222978.p1  ORF type:complete len:311 (+),score=59.70 NODE_7223_length_1598_cov_6.222978:163-1095(+)